MRIAYAVPTREEYGFGRYLAQLLGALAEIDDENEYFIFTVGDAADKIPGRATKIALPDRRPRFRWRNGVLAKACREHRIDLMHFHNNTIWSRNTIPTVVTLHHLTFAYPPEEKAVSLFERIYIRRLMKKIARHADRILTGSEFSAREIERLLNVRPTTIPDAADPQFRPATPEEIRRVRKLHSLDRPYIFFPGSLGIRKNIPGMVRAFRRFNRDGKFEFVIAGGAPDAFGYRAASREDIEGPDVRLLGFVPPEEIPPLYSGAEALFFVTHYEGFGIPIVEAFACGCPVVTSKRAAAPEVAGDAAILADPDKEEDMVRALERVSAERASLIERGSRRAKDFSWTRTAQQTLDVYREVLAG